MKVQRSHAGLGERYGARTDACPPHDLQEKGVFESGVKYVKKSFMPLRAFHDLPDANRQLREWIMQEASAREHGTTREQPLTRFAIEKPLLTALPDVPPALAAWHRSSCRSHPASQGALLSAVRSCRQDTLGEGDRHGLAVVPSA
ncbi:hypothetical protein LJ656_30025 [Paraburkholderia sp. MMS20-SJTR3]|uniref:Integrase catalytic domain-containing protein n=1 Tax=Paraburkholderia sejongensis TaxID=2886946 RepID=A0ABS8K3U4_9BURK|nr:hypothetical protein [Paraburkholderia sp. MMS20-SJTR3]MCC8396832.1 hypothetical protein [Paraburkholderia sp. MMS20-SJTR3]